MDGRAYPMLVRAQAVERRHRFWSIVDQDALGNLDDDPGRGDPVAAQRGAEHGTNIGVAELQR